MDKTATLRAASLWLAPLARLAALVTAAVVLTRSAGTAGVDLDLLRVLLQVLG